MWNTLRREKVRLGGETVDSRSRTLMKAALIVLVISLSVRTTIVACSTITPVSDFASYDRLAVRLLADREFGDATWRAYRTPGYPGFLAMVYSVFGHSWKAAGFVQAILGGMTSVMLVLLVARFASVRTAAIAGLLHTFSPTSVAYVPVLASENLAVFLLVLGLLLLADVDRRNGWRRTGAVGMSGAVFGLLLLTRPAALFLFPAWLLLTAYSPRKGVLRIRSALLFVVVIMVVLSPWMVRNHRCGLGRFTLSTVGSLNLYMGNNDLARSGGYCRDAVRPDFSKMGEGAREDAYLDAACAWIWRNPGRFAALCGCRLARQLGTRADSWAGSYLLSTAKVDQAHLAARAHAPGRKTDPGYLLKLSQHTRRRNVAFFESCRIVVAPLSLLALCLSVVRWRRFAIVVWPVCFYILGLSLTFGSERFRELSDPLLLIPVAALLSDLFFGTRDLGARPSRVVKLVATWSYWSYVGGDIRHDSGIACICFRHALCQSRRLTRRGQK